ncbi:MAG TPA: hypothetical protein VMP01_26510 [Pirellulaceae bacterium]|nr:hypothetical protein [Pirellulaceae bacterium]
MTKFGQVRWVVIIALGVFAGLLLWTALNAFVAEWQRQVEAAKKQAIEREVRDESERIRKETDKMLAELNRKQREADRKRQDEAERSRKATEKLLAERAVVSRLWEQILDKVLPEYGGSFVDRLVSHPEYQGSFVQRLVRQPEYQERLKNVGLTQCQREELDAIRNRLLRHFETVEQKVWEGELRARQQWLVTELRGYPKSDLVLNCRNCVVCWLPSSPNQGACTWTCQHVKRIPAT